MVLKSSKPTSASPWQRHPEWGLRVTQDAYFSLLTDTKQLLLVTFCDTTSENGFFSGTRTDTQTDRHTDGQTDVEVEIVI